MRCRLSRRLGHACFYLSDFAASADAFERAAALSADPESASLLLSAAAFSHLWAHQYERCQQCTEEATTLARGRGYPPGEARALVVHGIHRGVHDADVDEYERCIRRGLEICARHPHEEVESFVRFHATLLAEWTGAYEETVRMAERAIYLGRKLRRPETIIFPTWFLGKARCCLGDYGGAIALLEEANALCERIGDRALRSRLLNTLGWCFAEIGDAERALGYNERAAVLAREIGDPEILSNAAINLANNHLDRADLDRALEYLEPIEETLSRPGDPWMRWRYALHARDTRARIELIRGDPERSLVLAAAELEEARRHRAPKIEARAHFMCASALLAMDRRDEAADAAELALRKATEIGYQRAVWRAHLLLAEKERRAGNRAAAIEQTARARYVAERLARSLSDTDLGRHLIAAVGEHP